MEAVSYGQKTAWLGEARWRSQPMDMEDVSALQRKVRAWQADETGWRICQALFSRSGFTQPVREQAQADPDLLLFGPGDLI